MTPTKQKKPDRVPENPVKLSDPIKVYHPKFLG